MSKHASSHASAVRPRHRMYVPSSEPSMHVCDTASAGLGSPVSPPSGALAAAPPPLPPAPLPPMPGVTGGPMSTWLHGGVPVPPDEVVPSAGPVFVVSPPIVTQGFGGGFHRG